MCLQSNYIHVLILEQVRSDEIKRGDSVRFGVDLVSHTEWARTPPSTGQRTSEADHHKPYLDAEQSGSAIMPTLTPVPLPTPALVPVTIPTPAPLPISASIPLPTSTPAPSPAPTHVPVPAPVPSPAPTPVPVPTSTPILTPVAGRPGGTDQGIRPYVLTGKIGLSNYLCCPRRLGNSRAKGTARLLQVGTATSRGRKMSKPDRNARNRIVRRLRCVRWESVLREFVAISA